MSGGRFNYKQFDIADEVYGYDVGLSYGQDGFKQAKEAVSRDPFEDVEMSEIFWDMLCVLQSLDWYESGDTSESTYRADVAYFKKKWLGKPPEKRIGSIINRSVEKMKDDISTAFQDRTMFSEE